MNLENVVVVLAMYSGHLHSPFEAFGRGFNQIYVLQLQLP